MMHFPMMPRYKNIVSLMLVLILIAPNIIKLEHHHDHFVCKAKHEKHFHLYHEKCLICSFEFSTYTYSGNNVASAKADYQVFCGNYFQQSDITEKSKYSFLLRAPPLLANTHLFQT